MRDINRIIIHCSDSEFGNANRLRSKHIDKGYSTIGYHFVINNGKVYGSDEIGTHVADGFIETCRPVSMVGSHLKGENIDSIGICLIGNKLFTANQMDSLESLLKSLMLVHKIEPKNVLGHNELDKYSHCPKFNVRAYIDKHFTSLNNLKG